jgi:hypothetical protein
MSKNAAGNDDSGHEITKLQNLRREITEFAENVKSTYAPIKSKRDSEYTRVFGVDYSTRMQTNALVEVAQSNPDPAARLAALNLLSDKQYADVFSLCELVVNCDVSPSVRSSALLILSRSAKSRPLLAKALKILVGKLNDEFESAVVRRSAYFGILLSQGCDIRNFPPIREFSLQNHVDWKFIASLKLDQDVD